ncbi:MAG: hypothetical protein AAGA58_08700 [Verrucomicrobiota bacterium]
MGSTALNLSQPAGNQLSAPSERRAPELVIDPLIDRFDLTYLLRKHWWKLVLVPLLGAGLAFAYYKTQDPLYESSAELLIDPSFERIIQFEQIDGRLDSDLTGLKSLEHAIISDSVVLRVFDRLDLRNAQNFLPSSFSTTPNLSDAELVEFLRKERIWASLVPDTRLIRVNVLDSQPERAQEIAQAFTTEFEKFVYEQRRDEVEKSREAIAAQADAARKAALEADEKLAAFRQENPEIPVEQDHDLVAARLTRLGEELDRVAEERRGLEGQKEILDSIDPDKATIDAIELAQYRDLPHVSELLTALAGARTKFDVVKERYLEKHPSYKEAQAEVTRTESQLQGLVREIVSSVDAKYDAAVVKEATLSEELAVALERLAAMKDQSSDFRALQQQSERDWAVHQTLQTKLGENDVSTEVSSKIATVVSNPLVPFEPYSPNLLLHLVVGGGLGSLLGGAWILASVFGGLPFSNVRQLEERLGLPVIADWSKEEDVDDHNGKSAKLLRFIGASSEKTVQITAPNLNGAGESVATSIARFASEHGQKTLLILVHVGHEDCKLETTADPNLSLLRIRPEHVSDLRSFPQELEQLKANYDNIFIETGGANDPDMAEFIASHTDLDVIVVGKETTKKQVVEDRLRRLTDSGSTPAGLIVVGASQHG